MKKKDEKWYNEEIMRLGGVIAEKERALLSWLKIEKERKKNITDYHTAFDRLEKFIEELFNR